MDGHNASMIPSEGASLAERLYCTYNASGDPASAGRNYLGLPCPAWSALPENVRAKWEAVADYYIAVNLST